MPQTNEELEKIIKDLKSTSDERAILLTNISYMYWLMADAYRKAAERVKSVTAQPTLGQQSLGIILKCLWIAVAGVSQGMGAIAFAAFAGSDFIEKIAGKKLEDNDKDVVTSAGGTITDNGVDKIADGLKECFGLDGWSANSKIDIMDFFIKIEGRLRRLSISITQGFDISESDFGIGSDSNNYYGLPDMVEKIRNDQYWKFLIEKYDSNKKSDLMNNWKEVKEVLDAQMRRLVWSIYCRTQWANRVYDYTITLQSKSDINELAAEARFKHSWQSAPASEWPYKVWRHGANIEPAYWREICADFSGPEHDPRTDNKIVEKIFPKEKRNELNRSFAWISMAAVYCCQIRPAKLEYIRGTAAGFEYKNITDKIDWMKLNKHGILDYKILIEGTLSAGDMNKLLTSRSELIIISIAQILIGGDNKLVLETIKSRRATGKKGIWSDANAVLNQDANKNLSFRISGAEHRYILSNSRISIRIDASRSGFMNRKNVTLLIAKQESSSAAPNQTSASGSFAGIPSQSEKWTTSTIEKTAVWTSELWINTRVPKEEGRYALYLDECTNPDGLYDDVYYPKQAWLFTVFKSVP